MKRHRFVLIALVGAAGALQGDTILEIASARAANAVRTQATSSFVLGEQDGAETVDITNVTFATTGSYVPGRPTEERLLLRTTTWLREVIDEKGIEATVTVESWPLGTDPAGAPLYKVSTDGVDATVDDNALIVIDRGSEDVAWWSVYALGTGTPFFDTFVPLLRFSLSTEMQTPRYIGFDVPPDNATDARLRDPTVVGVLAYASPERVIRRLLVTCSDMAQAGLLRSYWDTTRTLSLRKGASVPEQTLALELNWAANDPEEALAIAATIPIANDDLAAFQATLPACMALAPWSP